MLAGVQFSTAAEMATIHGAVYEWNSFDPLEDVIVEVNSTPPQSMLAKYGIYSFNLEPGDYLISASFYGGNNLVAYTEEEITITGDGDYVMDLLLLPVYYDAPFNGTEFSELDEIANLSDANDRETNPFSLSIILILIFIAVLSVGGYYFVKQRSVTSISEDDSHHISHDNFGSIIPDDKWQELPDDLREVIDLIAKNEGRITQKELRTKVKHSEAKVSLMVSDLENRGIVQKFKKGRGNVIILVGSEQPNQNV
ncbi:winged helix-turn-helix transcriptional regulator [Methanolobus sp. ZRKC4]|uniref:helix-turn-helix transcriptional regulator n=1 Tax=Methanolobus sp. ZRKC4 TaxID=3125787 RepID=UPI00324548AB